MALLNKSVFESITQVQQILAQFERRSSKNSEQFLLKDMLNINGLEVHSTYSLSEKSNELSDSNESSDISSDSDFTLFEERKEQ